MLKISGESLKGETQFGIDPTAINYLSEQIGEAAALGVEIAVVMGGGNIWRGEAAESRGMDRATAGTIAVEGVALGDLDDEALTGLRRERVGFVFQFFNLLPTLTLAENIALPLLLAGVSPAEGTARAREGAERVGLGHRLAHFPAQVSGGELQRAAVARALIHKPALLIADEPTGNLDTESGQRVLEVLRTLHLSLIHI